MPFVIPLRDQVRGILRDAGKDAWTDEQIVGALYEAEYVIVNHKPDATKTLGNILLASGTEQSIESLTPAPARLMDVIGNIEDGMLTRAVRRINRTDMDAQFPNWHSAEKKTLVYEWMFDDRNPLVFFVNPPVAAGLQKNGNPYPATILEVLYSALPVSYPSTISDTTPTTVGELYAPMMPEWALYRLFGHDVENTVNVQRSAQHLSVFSNLLGVKLQTEKIYSPKVREHNSR